MKFSSLAYVETRRYVWNKCLTKSCNPCRSLKVVKGYYTTAERSLLKLQLGIPRKSNLYESSPVAFVTKQTTLTEYKTAQVYFN